MTKKHKKKQSADTAAHTQHTIETGAAPQCPKSPSMKSVFKAFFKNVEGQLFLSSMLTLAMASIAQAVELITAIAGQWTLSRYFLYTTGSRLFRKEMHLYHSLAFAIISVLNVLGGYYVTLFAMRIFKPQTFRERMIIVISALAMPTIVALQLSYKFVFASKLLAALPPILGFALGMMAAIRQAKTDNPFSKFNWD